MAGKTAAQPPAPTADAEFSSNYELSEQNNEKTLYA
jgi:hypothetical protein